MIFSLSCQCMHVSTTWRNIILLVKTPKESIRMPKFCKRTWPCPCDVTSLDHKYMVGLRDENFIAEKRWIFMIIKAKRCFGFKKGTWISVQTVWTYFLVFFKVKRKWDPDNCITQQSNHFQLNLNQQQEQKYHYKPQHTLNNNLRDLGPNNDEDKPLRPQELLWGLWGSTEGCALKRNNEITHTPCAF